MKNNDDVGDEMMRFQTAYESATWWSNITSLCVEEIDALEQSGASKEILKSYSDRLNALVNRLKFEDKEVEKIAKRIEELKKLGKIHNEFSFKKKNPKK